MIVKRLTKLILRRHLYRGSQQLRRVRFDALRQVSWLTNTLDELKSEILPVEPADLLLADEVAEQNAFPLSIHVSTPHYSQYRCVQADPLSCLPAATSAKRRCDRCDFPGWLPIKGELVGKKGRYSIVKRLGSRGIGRQYAGVDIQSEEPVVIREYLLPHRYFSREEQRDRQEKFVNLAGLTLADGRTLDLRIVAPIEAIADSAGNRCYLIAPALDSSPTLNRYCAQHGPLPSQTIFQILDQVLQSLTCLHEQKFLLPTGQTQSGLVHGNIDLDTLLWVHTDRPKIRPLPTSSAAIAPTYLDSLTAPDGFVYLTDLSLWEKLFDPANANASYPDYQQDLNALGEVAFFLLNGATLGTDAKPLNPRMKSDWPEGTPLPLKSFIMRLTGIEAPFSSAESARAALLSLPVETAVSQYEYRTDELLPQKIDWYKRALPLLIVAALAALGTLGWLLLRSRRPLYAEPPIPSCCLDTVAAVPDGEYVYASPKSAYWYPLFRSTPDANSASLSAQPTIFDRIKETHPELSVKGRAAESVEDAIATIQAGQAEFAVVPLTADLPPDITSTTIAYDTLVPIVAFSYPDRKKGLPSNLDGAIALSDLEQIFSGTINHWRQISSNQLPLKRYWLADEAAQSLFIQRMFNEGTELNSAAPKQDRFINSSVRAEALPTIPMMRSILRDFENKTTGSIGIAPLSEVANQCSVYPLALTVEGETVSPLVFDNSKRITPRSDLCDRKGSYSPNAAAIRSGDYPLAYPLAIVYPFDNTRSTIGQKLAELLLTQESQQTLVDSGLVSAYPLPTSSRSASR